MGSRLSSAAASTSVSACSSWSRGVLLSLLNHRLQTAVDIDGETVSLSKYAGKVVIVVNVASACGYTDQNYAGLQKVYDKYKEYGLEILGFPCNQFGNQESGSEQEIKAFCTSKYHVTFPMFSKVGQGAAAAVLDSPRFSLVVESSDDCPARSHAD